jgi:hypothetical protein
MSAEDRGPQVELQSISREEFGKTNRGSSIQPPLRTQTVRIACPRKFFPLRNQHMISITAVEASLDVAEAV